MSTFFTGLLETSMHKAPEHGRLALRANPHCESKCHRASRLLVTNMLVAFSNNNVELSNFISMIIYLHCTDTNEKHPQVHSTIQ